MSETRGIRTQHDVEAIERTGLPPLPASTYEVIGQTAGRAPEAPALSFFPDVDAHRAPQTWTYRELAARITQAANLFHRLGATKDTVIALALPNLPETHFAIWGAEAAGIVFPINPLLDGAAIAALLEASGAQILVIAPGLLRKLAGKFPSVKHVLAVDEFTAALAREDGSALASGRTFSSSDGSSWFATGGTTGLPKIAMRTHGNEIADAYILHQAIGDAIGPGTVVLCGLPLFHVNAVLVSGLLPFSRGAHVLLATPEGYRAAGLLPRLWEIVEHHRVNFFSGVPTIFAGLLQIPVGSRDVSSLQYGLCGAAPMPIEVFRAFEERTGVKILEGYGLTEATCVSALNPIRGERRVGSIGLRLPGQLMKPVVLDEQGRYVRDCAAGEVGEIAVSGPNVFAGYHNPAQNAGIWIDCGDGRRWLNTGDLGRRDAEGYFWLTGRKKELIKRGGHSIDPAVIEEPLHRHPDVQIAAAVGRPDPHAGEIPVAYVQPKPGAALDEAALLEYLAREIGERAAVPKRVHVLSQIPLTAVGKIFKPELRRREVEGALQAALRDAGVAFHSLEASQDASRGLVAEVELEPGASQDAARQVLGRFALPFTLRRAATSR